MSKPDSQTTGPDLSDNPLEWLEARKRDAEPGDAPASEESTTSPAEPNVAPDPAPAQPAVRWQDVEFGEDVPNAFFKGKKVPEVLKSYDHAVHAKQEAERERNELRRQLEMVQREREAEAVARRVIAEQQAQPARQPEDPYADIERLWFEDPRAAAAKLREQTIAEARALATQEAERVQQSMTQAQYEQTVKEQGYKAFGDTVQLLKQRHGWSDEEAVMRTEAIIPFLTRQDLSYFNQGGPTRFENFVDVADRLYGRGAVAPAPQPPVVVAPPPQLSDPPGSKRPSTVASRPAQPSPLTSEKEAALRRFAEATGVSPDKLVARMSANGGSRG